MPYFSLSRGLGATLLAFGALWTLSVSAAPTERVAPLPIDFKLTPEQIDASCKSELAAAGQRVDAMVHGRARRTFSTVSEPLEAVTADLTDNLGAQTLLFQVAPDQAVRDASERCNSSVSGFVAALSARPDVYAALAAAATSHTARTVAQKKLLELQLVTAKRAGAGLPEAQRQRFVAIAQEIADLENNFQSNLANDVQTVALTPEQTPGLKPDFLAPLPRDAEGRVLVPVNESTYSRFLTTAASASARQAFYVAYQTRGGAANVDVLQRTLALRDEAAKLLGYPNFAAYTLADRMAGTTQRVDQFLAHLDERLMPLARQQRNDLTGVKGAPIEEWDRAFYGEQVRQKQFSLDRDAVRQYFPAQHTIDAVLQIYSRMLGLTFTKADDLPTWHPDVVGYRVHDAVSGTDRGVFYLDLFPRPGKYSHFANMGPTSRRVMPDGSVRAAVNAIVGNWPAPTPGRPSLLSHVDVLVFFHEFGHNVAALCADTPYETLNGGYRQDFVEAPSQMLENFVWDPAVLKQISAHVDTGAALPDAMIASLNAARHYNQAWNEVSYDLFYARLDQTYHSSPPPVDTTGLWRSLNAQITPDTFVDGTLPQASFGHLMNGYEANYYAYAWAKVYAQDMFTAFQRDGLLNPAVWRRYRHDVLAPARAVEPDVLVETFLGRKPNPNAFYADLGLPPP